MSVKHVNEPNQSSDLRSKKSCGAAIQIQGIQEIQVIEQSIS
ncbi:hypothetical protein [Legionella longbeachae]|nr:hypothetical protein [Legionella longbeachae]EEZ97064.1 hypothetical protein LLB_2266 [Legionella longbeachae D-4968]VEE03981.1 Uncharacterised protein [Legionella oakridgensis]